MNDEIRSDWERRQRAALLLYDHPYAGPRGRASGLLRVFRWLLTLLVVAVVTAIVIGLLTGCSP